MLEGLIGNYGAVAVFIGAAVEGETAAFLGGVLAHRHLMAYWQVALAACLGSFAADQFFFLAGRRARRAVWVRRVAASPLVARATALLEAHPVAFILAFRFLYGVRTVSPVAVGLSRVPAMRFLILNAIAAIAWGLAVTTIGYLFGNGVEALFGRLHLHVHLLIALAVAVCLAVVAALLSRRLIGRP
ncbi:DedA family protein [Rhizobiaceae bacterium BDR2-2]|uniref:DedA family protein n=1 Tax=Ectorhizobium quercum TaxID=2965071 RepID=A0AAE3SX54_9HYPH|nr:DedA family protein [Ectorhizobium quercum]MCX8999892.1 DedA family protein [Ectorhizobium quercum]